VVLVDQRGTGRSAPLLCEDTPPTAALAEVIDAARQFDKLRACRARLQTLPHGDLRQYTTWIAMQDADAVRAALGATQVNVIGGSYGTRAALEYLRQFPQAVRRAVIDGVAPPDMVIPASFSTDNQAALEAVFAACEAESACRARHPSLRADWRALMASLPREVSVIHPVTGEPQKLQLTHDALVSLVRGPLYAPILASALPQAIADATRGRFDGLMGLAGALGGGRLGRISEGMHFSVVCAEDMPRLEQATDAPGADFGNSFAAQYRETCKDWPRGSVPAAFYTLPPAPAPVLVLSGGADPVTPPRHGERVTRVLGAKARHVVVPQAGHGVMAIGCMRDALFRFIDADSDDEAMKVDASCAATMPRPPAFRPVTAPTGAEAAK
jgi:pimeloyl-ACP methyl ester carboxylesterase